MSSAGFDTIVKMHPDLAQDLNEIREHLAILSVGQFFTAQRVQSFTTLDLTTISSILSILEDKGLVKKDRVFWCEKCDQPVEDDEDEEIPKCDLCLEPVEITQEGFRLLKKINGSKPWYADYKDLSNYTEFQRRFLEGVPRFIHTLQAIPPKFLKEASERNKSVKEHDFRNEMQRAVSFLCGADGEVSRTNGRCDLIIRENSKDLNSIVGEFKVWPRNDYKEVIDQLLGYFTDFEDLGFVFMVNENKSSIGELYKSQVLCANKSLVPNTIEDAPILNSNDHFEHYLSFHKLSGGRVVKVFHFIFNIYYGGENSSTHT